MKNVLIIGAHYDDTELGAGGTAAKIAGGGGVNVYKLTLTDNVTRFVQRGINVDYASSRESSKRACAILGIKEITDFEPVQCTQLHYSTGIMQKIESILYQLSIDTVFIHFSHDMNQDHEEASKLCITAARHCANIFQYQSNGYCLDEAFYPTYFFDISRMIDKKREALAQYGDEHNRFDRLFQMNIERNHVWGYMNQVEYAEGFRVVKYLEA